MKAHWVLGTKGVKVPNPWINNIRKKNYLCIIRNKVSAVCSRYGARGAKLVANKIEAYIDSDGGGHNIGSIGRWCASHPTHMLQQHACSSCSYDFTSANTKINLITCMEFIVKLYIVQNANLSELRRCVFLIDQCNQTCKEGNIWHCLIIRKIQETILNWSHTHIYMTNRQGQSFTCRALEAPAKLCTEWPVLQMRQFTCDEQMAWSSLLPTSSGGSRISI